jgi:hypothetical protein
MYCIIQKIQNRKPNPYGEPKEIIVEPWTSTIDGVTTTHYSHHYSEERFNRLVRDAYKISMRESYRENGKVKAKQWVICTMDYYDLATGSVWPGDYILQSNLEKKLNEMEISEERLWYYVYEKLTPIQKSIQEEFEKTEEYHTAQEHRDVISDYQEAQLAFDEVYGKGSYKTCYDVFNTLRDNQQLERLKEQKRQSDEYARRSYQSYSSSNYDWSSLLGNTGASKYSDSEKKMLKKIYRVAAAKFHPDVMQNHDDTMMKFLGKLKQQWGI